MWDGTRNNMQSDFQRKWYKVVIEKESNIVAGIDPQGLSEDINISDWCMQYIEDVKDHVAAIKVNPKCFFDLDDGNKILREIAKRCKDNGLVAIIDEKLSDIGNSNKIGADKVQSLGYDAVTIAPFASNAKEIIDHCKQNKFGVINMGLMSDPKFMIESTKYINVKTGRQLLWDRVEESLKAYVDGFVLGGTFKEGGEYYEEFQKFLEVTKDSNCLYLSPGFGAQGGDLKEFLRMLMEKGIDPKSVMASYSRYLMFAENRKEAVKELQAIYQQAVSYENKELNKIWK